MREGRDLLRLILQSLYGLVVVIATFGMVVGILALMMVVMLYVDQRLITYIVDLVRLR